MRDRIHGAGRALPELPWRRGRFRSLAGIFLALLWLSSRGSAQEGYHFLIADVEGRPGEPVSIGVEGAHERSAQGFSFALRYPSDLLTIDAVHIRDTILEAIGTDFFETEVDPARGFLVVGVLTDAEAPFEGTVIPSIGQPLLFFTVEARISAEAEDDLLLELEDGLGEPPISNLFVVDDEPVRVSELTSGRIALLPAEDVPIFIRGDATLDGRRELTDAIAILDYQFRGIGTPACFDAADANDDARINIADPIYLLSFLFGGGPAPPPPLGLPGPDPTEDGLGCARSLAR